ncbi:hypothetical protein BJY00DRAFT_295917 [Aspergillus carlsbadensis]|nr:hypothetical protein BJY00DRAFT_295917 [Aspergillus carlsbadensis]
MNGLSLMILLPADDHPRQGPASTSSSDCSGLPSWRSCDCVFSDEHACLLLIRYFILLTWIILYTSRDSKAAQNPASLPRYLRGLIL